jgi:capsular polysaccharide export protein
VTKEFRLYLARLLLMQWQTIERRIFTLRIKHCGFPYHLALLQLEHDSSLQKHSPFETKPDFLDLVIDGSVKGAPKHYRLVFKAHPLADGRAPIRKSIHTMSKK